MNSLQMRITKEVKSFDIRALLDLLSHMGYLSDDIFFRGKQTSASRPSFIEEIAFSCPPSNKVVITVNMGLLSNSSTLPSYFFKAFEGDSAGSEAFLRFIAFFDHKLIRDFIESTSPEKNPRVIPDWQDFKGCYLNMLNFQSTSSLHWLFEEVFPDLRVLIKKSKQSFEYSGKAFRLGHSELASRNILGGRRRSSLPGLSVHLYADEDMYSSKKTWVYEARRRLNEILLPILKHSRTFLQVSLHLQNNSSSLLLQKESELGFESLRGESNHKKPIILFSGRVLGKELLSSPRISHEENAYKIKQETPALASAQ